MNRVRLISGCNEKGPACVLVESGATRLMLDIGYGPDPGRRPDLSGIGPVDALLLSHGHRDHTGSLALASQLGDPPVWCTSAVAAMLGPVLDPAVDRQTLPLSGACEIAGIRVRTGRNGHAPGGVWLHLALAGGDLLYCGDCSVESPLYVFDPPPPATVMVIDASYGDYDTPLEAAARALVDVLGPAPDAILPVPPGGRGPEIAWWLATRCGLPIQLGDDLRQSIARLCTDASDSVQPQVLDALWALARIAPGLSDAPAVRLTGSADGASGDSANLLARLSGRSQTTIVFTGYLPASTPARRLTDAGRARYLRWNVHPRQRDNLDMVRQTGARFVLPAFGEHAQMAALRAHLRYELPMSDQPTQGQATDGQPTNDKKAPAHLVLEPAYDWPYDRPSASAA